MLGAVPSPRDIMVSNNGLITCPHEGDLHKYINYNSMSNGGKKIHSDRKTCNSKAQLM